MAKKNESINISICAESADTFLMLGTKFFEERHNSAVFLYRYLAPCTVNLSFSCELYMKAIIASENSLDGVWGEIQRGHELDALFAQISTSVQNKIRTEYAKWTSLKTLDECLAIHRRAFMDWRYYFEKRDDSISVEIQSLYNLTVSIHNIYMEVAGNAP